MNAFLTLGLAFLAVGAACAVAALLSAPGVARVAWILALNFGVLGAVFAATSPMLGLGPGARRALLADGVRTTAVIDEVRPTASRIGGRPIVVLLLRLDDGGGQARVIRVREAVLPWHGARLQKGARLEVCYDPTKPSRVAIDWEAVERA